MIEDPLWRLRHALAGLALALLLSVLLAALLGSLLGDALIAALATSPADGGYTVRVIFYALLLLHIVVGAVVLFMRVAQHETRPISAGRVLLWLLSLWCWPLLLMRRGAGPSSGPDPRA